METLLAVILLYLLLLLEGTLAVWFVFRRS